MDAWDVIPSYPTADRLSNQALAALPVTEVSVERFSAMKLFLSGLRSWLKQNAFEAKLLLCTNTILTIK